MVNQWAVKYFGDIVNHLFSDLNFNTPASKRPTTQMVSLITLPLSSAIPDTLSVELLQEVQGP